MESQILNSIGLGKTDPAIFIIILLACNVILMIWMIVVGNKRRKMEKRYEAFMRGKDLESLEDVITERFDQIDKMIKDTEDNSRVNNEILEKMVGTVQKTGIVKYDAFNEMGGKLSFALAMLNGENNGFVINAMHSREGCYTYIKEIIKGESYIPLGAEEKEALNQALDIISDEG